MGNALQFVDAEVEVLGAALDIEEAFQQARAGVRDALWRGVEQDGDLRRQEIVTREQADVLFAEVELREQRLQFGTERDGQLRETVHGVGIGGSCVVGR